MTGNNIKEKQFILILSFLVGIFTAFAALLLKFFIHQIQNFLTDNFNATEANYLYLVLSGSGYLPDRIVCPLRGEGRHQSWCYENLVCHLAATRTYQRHNTWSSIIASSITIGFGGSVGAEAPIVVDGFGYRF